MIIFLSVCSQLYRKCYIITKISSTADSWSDFDSRVCGANGWSIVSLHSLEEQNFLGYYVMSIDFDLNALSSQGNTAYIGMCFNAKIHLYILEGKQVKCVTVYRQIGSCVLKFCQFALFMILTFCNMGRISIKL